MNSYIRFFKGYVYIRISGPGSARFMNICSKRGIRFWNMVKQEEDYYINILIKDFRKLPEIVRKTGVRASIVSKHGLPFFFAKLSYRKCFVLGAIACFLWLFYMSNFIWAYEIEGNISISDEMIIDYLENNQIEIGTKWKEINADSLEKGFRTEFPDITWISVGQDGTALTIDIKERDVAGYEQEDVFASNLYAPCDGIVTSVLVRSGIAKVKEGDEVVAGQVVVEGILPVVKTDGTITGYQLVNADADVSVCCKESYQDEISFYQNEKVYTGRKTNDYYIRMYDTTLQLSWFPPAYEYATESSTFYQWKLGEHFYLPVWFGCGERKEYVLNNIKQDKNTLEAKLYENLDFFLQSLEEKGVQNIQKDVKISTSGSMLILSGELTNVNSNMIREEINASIGTELENGQYNSVVNGNEH